MKWRPHGRERVVSDAGWGGDEDGEDDDGGGGGHVRRAGEECAVMIVEAVRARVDELQARADTEAAAAEAAEKATPAASDAPKRRSVARRLIWFHHIKSPTKRRHALAWARELNLGGFCKPGYPGVIVVEGAAGDADEYVSRLRSLSWKAMSVRVTEDEDAEEEEEAAIEGGGTASDVARRLPRAFVELPENGLGTLGDALKAAGLQHLMAAVLKQPAARWNGGVD